MGSWIPMIRERHKMRTIEAESIKEVFSSVPGCSSKEGWVLEVKRRAGAIRSRMINNRGSARIDLA